MGDENQDQPRVIITKKLQCDVDEELHDAFRILTIQYRLTGRALLEKLILDEVKRQTEPQEANNG